ncbi:MAG TPA: hypothetical protein VKT77_23190 [Chthonomonadaceae bacterium]|nr:hypothetical protein [Chthonomonadaceae bacterium]
MRLFIVPLVLLPAIVCLADAPIPREVDHWLIQKPPKEDSQAWNAANRSEYEWQVAEENGRVVASNLPGGPAKQPALPFKLQPSNPKARLHALQVDDGWLIGSDAGEWGGELAWYSADGKRTYPIIRGNIHCVQRTKLGVVAVRGLAHLTMNDGDLLRLRRARTDRWIAESIVDLKSAPYAMTTERDGSLIIVTSRTLLRVDLDSHARVLVKGAFWWGMYPNSIVETANGDIYLGMRHGVARVRAAGRPAAVDWLLPNREFVNATPAIP